MRPALSARKWYVPFRLSAPEPFRSAIPLVSAGIVCLGLIPLLGPRQQPLHWATSGAVVFFGVLLYLRHRLRRLGQPLASVLAGPTRDAGRTVLITSGVILVMVLVIAIQRVLAGNPTRLLSLLLPLLTFLWLGCLGLLALRLPRKPLAGTLPAHSEFPAKAESWKPSAMSGRESNQA